MTRDYDAMRDLINGAGGKFVGVTFVKKDGSLRVMNVQPAKLKFEVKGDAASPSAAQGARTRAERYPNLMPVWDTAKKAIRSINLDTVKQIKIGGNVHTFGKEA